MEEKHDVSDCTLNAICMLIKRIDELERRCEKLEEQKSIHNAIDDVLNIQKQLDDHSKKIHNLGSYLEPIHNKLDKINNRLDEHYGKMQNHDTCLDSLSHRIDGVNTQVDTLKARLNMIWGAGDEEKDVKKAAKVIHDYCHNAKSCYVCPFRLTNKAGMSICAFTGIIPTGWRMWKEEDK